MLTWYRLLERDGVSVVDVACRHERGRGRTVEATRGHALVFVRRGCFMRSADGVAQVLEPTVAYCCNPGEEERFDHPHHHGDDCTGVGLGAELVDALAGERLPSGSIPVSPALDLRHRLLLAACRRGEDPHEAVERAIDLAGAALGHAPRQLGAARPATARARTALVDGAREALAGDTSLGLPELARRLAVSPHHLSRVFREGTGHTVSRHRMRLRARTALERMAGGERDLARLAADLGFADQSHLCRVVRAETGRTPAALRAALAA
jgi:AraC-like DNA-binding protein